MSTLNALDSRSYLIRQGHKVPAHSPQFNARGWRNSAEALALANAPKRKVRKVAESAKVAETFGGSVSLNVARLKRERFGHKVEVQKVSNRSEAETLGLSALTVKRLRAVAKARGLKGYSKARKSELLAMLSA